MKPDDVTIVVVPRDHFSDTQEALESLYAHTEAPFKLVYVDGGSPPRTARYLRDKASAHGFTLLRSEHYLTPNQARNLGVSRAQTRYVVFIDNDVVVAPRWLPPLVDCADSTQAAVVGPLNYERRPLHQTVHFAGGDARIDVTRENGVERRTLIDRIHKAPVPSRTPTEAAEFHCMLVRLDRFREVGGLDEKLLSTRENIDFCLAVRAAGGTVYLEPASRVTYLPPVPLRWSDVPFFALRWSDAWDLSSFRHLRDKWRLDEDEYFLRQYRHIGWRRQGLMMQGGVLRWMHSWRLRSGVERLLRPLEKRINAAIARRHAQRHGLQLRA